MVRASVTHNRVLPGIVAMDVPRRRELEGVYETLPWEVIPSVINR